MLLGIEGYNLCGNLLSNAENVRGLFDTLVRNLRNMKQSIDAGFKLHEGAEVYHAGDFSGNGISYAVRAVLCPGVVLRESDGKSDFVFFDLFDVGLNLVADSEELFGVVDASPAHLGNMEQSVRSAKVYERAEIGEILDLARDDHSHGNAAKEFLKSCFFLSFDHLLAVSDDAALAGVELNQHELYFLTLVLVEVSFESVGNKAGGYEH